jgi:hypothetical protein
MELNATTTSPLVYNMSSRPTNDLLTFLYSRHLFMAFMVVIIVLSVVGNVFLLVILVLSSNKRES